MASSTSINKRPRTSDCSQSGKDERSRSYSQSRKKGEVPKQYTAAYEVHILAKGLDMDYRRGEDFVSKESKKTCAEILQIHVHVIRPTAVPQDNIRDVVGDCQHRNEPIVNRDVTPLIIPSLRLLYYWGANDLKHVVDEVNASWYEQCVLEGPQIHPDLAIGLFSSAFTEGEIDKLKRYTSVDNWTKVTLEMYFPFLMCEVKCGREGLDMADRQNMHSCSVAIRALLRIEQEADKYRPEKKMESLNGQVLVFSISHDQQDARLYGHYAQVQGEKWTYYRYHIQKFDLIKKEGLLAIHNAVRNILKAHLPEHVQRLQDALAALPDPCDQPDSTGLSFVASEISLNADNSQQNRDADGFVVPPRPDSSQNSGAKKKGQESRLAEQIERLTQQLGIQRQEHKEEMEQQRKREERQRQEHKEELERQRQEMERQRKESEEKMEKLLQRLLAKPAD
jgi:hypothetical protein